MHIYIRVALKPNDLLIVLYKKKHDKPDMAKKTIYPETRGRKNKVLKRPIDLTGINKAPIVG